LIEVFSLLLPRQRIENPHGDPEEETETELPTEEHTRDQIEIPDLLMMMLLLHLPQNARESKSSLDLLNPHHHRPMHIRSQPSLTPLEKPRLVMRTQL